MGQELCCISNRDRDLNKDVLADISNTDVLADISKTDVLAIDISKEYPIYILSIIVVPGIPEVHVRGSTIYNRIKYASYGKSFIVKKLGYLESGQIQILNIKLKLAIELHEKHLIESKLNYSSVYKELIKQPTSKHLVQISYRLKLGMYTELLYMETKNINRLKKNIKNEKNRIIGTSNKLKVMFRTLLYIYYDLTKLYPSQNSCANFSFTQNGTDIVKKFVHKLVELYIDRSQIGWVRKKKIYMGEYNYYQQELYYIMQSLLCIPSFKNLVETHRHYDKALITNITIDKIVKPLVKKKSKTDMKKK